MQNQVCASPAAHTPQRVFLSWDRSSGRSEIVSLKCEKLQLWGAKSNQLTVLVVFSGSLWSSLGIWVNLFRSCRIIVTEAYSKPEIGRAHV